MDGDETVARLSELGLTSYEAKTYVALTRGGQATAAEAARLAGVPRQRIYDVLASLVDRGLAVLRPGSVTKYAPAAPDVALEVLLDRRRHELSALEHTAAVVARELRSVAGAGQRQTEPLEYIEVVRGPRGIDECAHELRGKSGGETLLLSKPPYSAAHLAEIEDLPAASNQAYSVYELSALDDPAFTTALRRLDDAGVQLRFVPEVPLGLAVFDGSSVLFAMDDPAAADADTTMHILIKHPSLAKVLRTAVMACWSDGLTFEQALRTVTMTR